MRNSKNSTTEKQIKSLEIIVKKLGKEKKQLVKKLKAYLQVEGLTESVKREIKELLKRVQKK